MATPAKPTTYTQCERCGFWHAPAEPHCANCGNSFTVEVLIKNYEKKGEILGSIVAFLVGGLGFFALFYIIALGLRAAGVGDINSHAIREIIGTVFGVVFGLGGIFGMLLSAALGAERGGKVGKIFGNKKAAKRILKFIPAGFCQNENLIEQRLADIVKKELKIRQVMRELQRQGDPQRNRIRFQALDKGAAELSRQRDRYTEKLREIELIRWSNQLSPILNYSPQLNEKQATERLNTLSDIQTKGHKLAQKWKEDPLADEETRCADRLNQALTTCDQLRQDLLDLKTALAVGDISAFSKEEQRASQTALELLDTFNALPDVGGFTAGFKKLEDEYLRLQSEDEVRQLTK